MKRVNLDELQVIEQSQQAVIGGWNCFPGLGVWCGGGCFGLGCW